MKNIFNIAIASIFLASCSGALGTQLRSLVTTVSVGPSSASLSMHYGWPENNVGRSTAQIQDNVQLKASVNLGTTVVWKSSNPSVAQVSATTADGTNQASSCSVTVYPSGSPGPTSGTRGWLTGSGSR